MNKFKNVIIGVLAAFVVLGGLILLAKPAPGSRQDISSESKNSGEPSPLVSDKTFYDFGKISMAAGKVRTTFVLKNGAAQPTTVSKLYTSCMWTTAKFKKGGNAFGPFGMPGHGFVPKINQTIEPGEEAAVEVEFNPAAHGPAGVGRVQRDILLESASSAPFKLTVAAEVTP